MSDRVQDENPKGYTVTTVVHGMFPADRETELDLRRLVLDGSPPGVQPRPYVVAVALTVVSGAIDVTVEAIGDGGEIVLQGSDGRPLQPGDAVTLQAGDAIYFENATYGFAAVDGPAEVSYAVARIGPEDNWAVTCHPCPTYP